MSRPAAEIILSIEVDDFNGIDVLTAPGLYTVLYKDKPINLKHRYWNAQGEFKKYTRTTYSNNKAAINLCKKLNNLFNTTDFTVVKIL